MGEKILKKTVTALRQLLSQKGVYPEKIIIFGSRAAQKAKSDSDIDILILSKRFEGKTIFERVKMVRGVHRQLVKEIAIPADIAYCSPSEWINGKSIMIEAAKKDGWVYS